MRMYAWEEGEAWYDAGDWVAKENWLPLQPLILSDGWTVKLKVADSRIALERARGAPRSSSE